MGERWTAVMCAALAGSLLGCRPASTYVCSTDSQCGAEGQCEADGSCSFPDPGCESGRRFAEFTPSGNECVPAESGSSSTSTTSTTTTVEPASATLDPDETSTGTGTPPSESSSTSSGTGSISTSLSTSSEGSDSSSESSTGDTPTYDFFDDFERADSDDVGNGWVEKTPASFALQGGTIWRVTSTDSYPNNLVYRPDDAWTDAEAIVEVRWLTLEDFASPQCSLRTQTSDIDLPGSLTGYLLFVHGLTGELTISRQIAGAFTLQYTADMTGLIEVGVQYRLRLRVTGSDPVVLDGYLEELVDGAWTPHTEVHGEDNTADQILAAGTLAVGGHVELEHWVYESVALTSLDD